MKGNDMDSPAYRIRLQKWIIYAILAAIVLAIGVLGSLVVLRRGQAAQQILTGSLVVGEPASDFNLATLDGRELSLSQFRGQPVLINFWASWCVPCREEMPDLVRSYEAHKAEGFVILGLNLTHIDTLPDIEAFVKEFGTTFPVLLDKDGAVTERLYRIPGVPTSVFVNRDGIIARVQSGKMTGQQIDQYVAEILK